MHSQQRASVPAQEPYRALFEALDAACKDEVFPGCVALVWRNGHIVYHEAHGALASVGPSFLRATQRNTLYDLASLTKVLATTTLVALAVAEHRIGLDSPVPAPWSSACPNASLGDLLCHCAGLPAHREFFRGCTLGQADLVFAQLCQVKPEYQIGEKTIYSDLGFMILGAWLERIFAHSLVELVTERIAWPLGLTTRTIPRLGFHPLPEQTLRFAQFQQVLSNVAPTEVYNSTYWQHEHEPSWYSLRKPTGCAHYEVHDDNAYVMGGVAGHAGLFADAMAVFEVARAWLTCELPGLEQTTRKLFWQRTRVADSNRKLGWDGVDRSGQGSTGQAFSANAIGHLGFTGTSVWIDPGDNPDAISGRIVILLTNRVHPSRFNQKISAFRPIFHHLAVQL